MWKMELIWRVRVVGPCHPSIGAEWLEEIRVYKGAWSMQREAISNWKISLYGRRRRPESVRKA